MGTKNGKPVLRDEDVAAIAKKSGLSEAQIREDFNSFLADHPSGRLNKKEFKKCFTTASGKPGKATDTFVNNVFRMFDTDDNGYLSFVRSPEIIEKF